MDKLYQMLEQNCFKCTFFFLIALLFFGFFFAFYEWAGSDSEQHQVCIIHANSLSSVFGVSGGDFILFYSMNEFSSVWKAMSRVSRAG